LPHFKNAICKETSVLVEHITVPIIAPRRRQGQLEVVGMGPLAIMIAAGGPPFSS
jgi:hypothetical protein